MNQRLLSCSDDVLEEGDVGDSVVHLIELEESILSPSLMIGVIDKDGAKRMMMMVKRMDDDDDAEKDDNDDVITIIIDINKHIQYIYTCL